MFIKVIHSCGTNEVVPKDFLIIKCNYLLPHSSPPVVPSPECYHFKSSSGLSFSNAPVVSIDLFIHSLKPHIY